jgi:hypothetical protein
MRAILELPFPAFGINLPVRAYPIYTMTMFLGILLQTAGQLNKPSPAKLHQASV